MIHVLCDFELLYQIRVIGDKEYAVENLGLLRLTRLLVLWLESTAHICETRLVNDSIRNIVFPDIP